MENFAQWLQQRMGERGLSQADVARIGGISPSQVANVLNGKRRPGNDACLAFARALDVPPEEVQRRAGLLPPARPNDQEADHFSHLFMGMKPEDRRSVVDYMEYLSNRNARRTKNDGEQNGGR